MLEEKEARVRILERVIPGAAVAVRLAEAVGLIAAEERRAGIPLPGFDNSQMDGYAVRAVDAGMGAQLRVTGEQPAGRRRQLRTGPGECVRIFTGAPMPEGADAVVMQEDVEVLGDGSIRIRERAQGGEFVRPKGADLCEGQVILRAGDRITAARVGLLASQGMDQIRVHPRPVVSVVTTGDELVAPGTTPLEEGQIYNSNGPMLEALLREAGVSQVRLFHALDEEGPLRDTVEKALNGADFCLLAGGVSVGEKDYVGRVLHGLRVESGFWKVNLKPGKPLRFGTREGKIVLGLPGNPVASYVTFLVFALPALQRWWGETVDPEHPALERREAVLAADLANRGNRPHYLRGRFEETSGRFAEAGIQQSHALHGLSGANALVRVPGNATLRQGERVEVYRLPGA